MPRISLSGDAYQERSVIAGAQETINLYAEDNSKDSQAPVPITYYPTPGFTLFGTPIAAGKARCSYRTSINTAYVVIAGNVYFLATNGATILVGTIPNTQTQCYMADNGLAAVLVDGVFGWTIDLQTNEFASIVDPSFLGAAFVLYMDTFFIFNQPNTANFYISLSNPSYGMLSGTSVGAGTIVGGSGYTNGVYQGVPLTGGSGTGASADITVAGNVVTDVVLDSGGQDYLVGDVLSATFPGGSGFTYTVTSVQLAFDPLDIAAKSGSADPIVAILSIHDELWLIGALTTEIWIGTGAADFFYQRVQGAYLEHGCIAPYTCANTDVIGIWLMQDRQGKNIVIQAAGYDVDEIGTPYLTDRFNNYATTNDAIGFFFQIGTHAFYALIFPTANESWLYSLKVKKWFRWVWFNANDGSLNRHRANCGMYFNEMNLIGDWQTGQIFTLSLETYTDNGNPIFRRKTFCHMLNNFDRVYYKYFDADMEVGEQDPTIVTEPMVSLSWSDDRGISYSMPVQQGMGLGGQTNTTITWNRLGGLTARDRLFKLEWEAPVKTALNGGFSEPIPART